MTETNLLRPERPKATANRTPTPALAAGHHSANFVGIVLAGSYQATERAFSGLLPRPLVPIAQVPLVTYALRWLSASNMVAVKVCTNGHAHLVEFSSMIGGSRLAVPLDFVDDASPRGPAGCARDAALTSDADTFVVVEGTIIPVLKLQPLLDEHRRRGAAMTVVVHDEALCRTAGGARLATPAGIYVLARRAFEAVPKTGFQDIKEHLIPSLRRRGERVVAYTTGDHCPRVMNAESYLAVNHWVIDQLPGNPDLVDASAVFCRTGELVAHPSAEVHPSATIIGPTLLGPGVSIRARATIVGPTSIGARTRVGEDAVVCRSVIWTGCEIGQRAFIDHATVADLVTIPAGGTVHHEVKLRPASRWSFGLHRLAEPLRLRSAPAGSVADLAVQ